MIVQSIASKVREAEHATPPIVEDVKDRIQGQSTLDGKQQKKSSSGHDEQQNRLTDKIVSEGLEKLGRRPEGKQADAKSGTPTEVWDALNPSCHSCQLVNLCPGHIMQICMWYLYQVMRCTILDKRWCAFLWAAAFACVFIAATLRVTRYENKSSLGKLHLVSDNFAHCCWQKGNIGIQVFGVSVRSKVSKDKAAGD